MEVLANLILCCGLGFGGVYGKSPDRMINHDLRRLPQIFLVTKRHPHTSHPHSGVRSLYCTSAGNYQNTEGFGKMTFKELLATGRLEGPGSVSQAYRPQILPARTATVAPRPIESKVGWGRPYALGPIK